MLGVSNRKWFTLGMYGSNIYSGCLNSVYVYTYADRKWVKRRICILLNRIEKIIIVNLSS